MRLSLRALSAPLAAVLLAAPLHAQTRADGTLCDRLGDSRYPDAHAQAEQLARAGGARGTFFQGCLAMGADKYSDAADLFERATKADDRNAVAHFWLGQAYGAQAQRANVFKQASLARKTKGEFDRAVELDPDYLDARHGLIEYYWQAPGIMGGSKDKARQQAEEIRRRDPYRGGLEAAGLASKEKDVARVQREYEQLATQFPDSLAPGVNVAALQLQQKQYDAAAQTIERLQRAHPDAMTPVYLVGRFAAESGQQLDRGEQALRRYLAYVPKPGEPSLANAHWRLGGIHERRGQVDAARAEYRAALALEPKHTGAKDALAKLK